MSAANEQFGGDWGGLGNEGTRWVYRYKAPSRPLLTGQAWACQLPALLARGSGNKRRCGGIQKLRPQTPALINPL